MRLLYILLIILSVHNILKTEYLLYKLDKSEQGKINLLLYKTMPKQEKEELKKLYMDTVFKYQFPTVQCFYNEFSEQEKNGYKAALKEPYGLFEFIKKKVEKQSKNQYSLTWVPTTIFELCALYIWATTAQEGSDRFGYSRDYINFKPNSKTEVFGDEAPESNDLDLYFITTDYVLEKHQDHGGFINPISSNNQFKKQLVKTIGDKIKPLNAFITQVQSNNYKHMYPIYEDSFFPIIEKYLTYEQQAFEQNMFILSRGTNGYSPAEFQNFTAIDYKLGKEDGISYGYSLFAGTIFERFMPKSIIGGGARSIDYIKECKIGYVILIKISDYTDNATTFLKDIFLLPSLTTTLELFGFGENFHPRLIETSNNHLTKSQENDVIIKFTKYLSEAKIIKTTTKGIATLNTLQEDIEFQTLEFINIILQNKSSIESQEVLARDALYKEMSQTFIDNYKKGNIQFKEIIPFLGNDTIKSLSKEQIQSLTTAHVDAFSNEQIEALTPEQIAILPIDGLSQDKLYKLSKPQTQALTNAQLKKLTNKQIEKIDMFLTDEQLNAFTPEQIEQIAPSSYLKRRIQDYKTDAKKQSQHQEAKTVLIQTLQLTGLL